MQANLQASRSEFDRTVKAVNPHWFDDSVNAPAGSAAPSTLRTQKVHTIQRAYALLQKYHQKTTETQSKRASKLIP